MLKVGHLVLRAGGPLLPLGRHVPFGLQKLVLEQAMKRLFTEPLADGEFDVLAGRWLRIEVSDLGMAWSLTRDRIGLRVAKDSPVDVLIRGNWKEFLLLASRQEDPDTLFFRRRLVIEGDTDLGLAVKNLVDSLDSELMPPRLWQLISWLGAAVKEHGGPAEARPVG